ncbi:MAG: gamma-glutamyl-gamma-aminobutyrate hydrolase family protein [Oscillospiraceae bacterium]|nr:gamma-glutamyl-gamma-aminobutyrate hydrolase family protein [Oscillospiraceae bacterium]
MLVLITAEEGVDAQGTGHFVASKRYSQALAGRGLTPLTPLNAALADDYAAFADGLILADGPPIHRGRYGGIYTDYEQLLALQTTRDELEFALLGAFLALGKPAFGIGRGADVINAALGGIPCGVRSDAARGRIADGLRVTEHAPDGSPAAFRHARLPVFGVHRAFDPGCAADEFDEFADAAAEKKGSLAAAAKPFILLAGAPAYDRMYRAPAVLLNKTYSGAVAAAGGVPVLAHGDARFAGAYLEAADALLLTGTAFFAPERESLPKLLAEEEPARDAFDKAVYRVFKAARKPILGICLGHQMINVYEGGDVIKDFKLTDGVEHMLYPHTVEAERDGFLHELFGGTFTVNSRHNDRIGALARTMRAAALSPDGVIEAAEHGELPIYTVQWHPERTTGGSPEPYDGADMSPLFKWFVGLARRERR